MPTQHMVQRCFYGIVKPLMLLLEEIIISLGTYAYADASRVGELNEAIRQKKGRFGCSDTHFQGHRISEEITLQGTDAQWQLLGQLGGGEAPPGQS